MATIHSQLREQCAFLPKDYIETRTGMLLALVAWGVEAGRLLATPRYKREYDGRLRKLTSSEAEDLLAEESPHWFFECPRRNIGMIGVPQGEVIKHYRPADALLPASTHDGATEPDQLRGLLRRLVDLLDLRTGHGDYVAGITGSYLLGANHADSDLDMVVYGLGEFERIRQRVAASLQSGDIGALQSAEWTETFKRRGCGISFEDYCWHEKRKFNKFNMSGVRVDLSCVGLPHACLAGAYRKMSLQTIHAVVTDATDAFSTPAIYRVTHPVVQRVVSFTPTYAGQALAGETISARGWVEESTEGARQLLVGTSREAEGEFLLVESRSR